MIKTFSTALSFLTVYSLPWSGDASSTPRDMAASFASFPLVGAFLGLGGLIPALLLSSVAPALVSAAIVVIFHAVSTRGLHLDGLADLADGLGGGFSPERRLEIMKDSHIGAFGTIALILALLLKTVSIAALIEHHAWAGLVMAPLLSRLSMVLTAYRSPSARSQSGLGRLFLDHMSVGDVRLAAVWAAGLSFLPAPWLALAAVPVMLATVGALRFVTRRALGGVTGDVLGAASEITEALVLATAACVSG